MVCTSGIRIDFDFYFVKQQDISSSGSLSGLLEYYMSVRLLNFLLSASFILVVGCSYFITSYPVLTVAAVIIGTLGGQINVCNVSYHPMRVREITLAIAWIVIQPLIHISYLFSFQQ